MTTINVINAYHTNDNTYTYLVKIPNFGSGRRVGNTLEEAKKNAENGILKIYKEKYQIINEYHIDGKKVTKNEFFAIA